MKRYTNVAVRALAAGALVTAVACGDLLNVKNINAIDETALGNPASAPNQANGVLAATTRMLAALTTPYAVSTDELDWIGSRDAWQELDRGILGNPSNEFSDGAFPFTGEARYLSDETIKRLDGFNTAGTLTDRSHLARTYLYGAIVYASIADMYDSYSIASSKTIAKAPLTRANMGQMYDTAIVYLDRANTLANAVGANAALVALRYNILAYRARVKHAKAVWASTPNGMTVLPPLVNDAGAVADANAAIALGTADQKFDLFNNIEATPGINVWFEVNGRNEQRVGSVYRVYATVPGSGLVDPVSGTLDPATLAQVTAFVTPSTTFGSQFGTLWITSTRELRLILAEASLAQGAIGQAGFATQINTVRALNAKPNYTTGTLAQDRAMLAYERKAQLWLMRRRLIDMYRFGETDARWVASSTGIDDVTRIKGLLYPLPTVERLANPCVLEPTGAGC